MAQANIDVIVFSPFGAKIRHDWLKNIAGTAFNIGTESMKYPALPSFCELGIVISDNKTVQRLNKKYRGIDKVTDVLSFSSISDGPWMGNGPDRRSETSNKAFTTPPGQPTPIGEVLIAYAEAERKAMTANTTVDDELTVLIVHGVLHLLGFDHIKPSEYITMHALERLALSRLGCDK